MGVKLGFPIWEEQRHRYARTGCYGRCVGFSERR